MASAGLRTNGSALEINPPGLITLTCTVPAVPVRLPGTTTPRLVGPLTMAGSVVVPKSTAAPAAKFVPVSWSVFGSPSATALGGAIAASVGAPRTANASAFDAPPAGGGFCTVICTLPGAASKSAGTSACSSVALCQHVVSSYAPKEG